jgi:magnesium-transporting ATPase (P-type)
MTKPFFIFQYLCSLIYILESVAVFGVLMIVFSFITTSINYALLYFSYKKIKKIAEKTYNVRVLRNNKYHVILNTQLVPGDLFEP